MTENGRACRKLWEANLTPQERLDGSILVCPCNHRRFSRIIRRALVPTLGFLHAQSWAGSGQEEVWPRWKYRVGFRVEQLMPLAN